ncbi:iron-containing alcohol dehydrogenase [Microbacterium sp. LRZ72]|uniref:iron-containing alcohol dehydrogenase n=1 Tax=Microbacterium sp. LRZ72 TaxID=2942481 RepID=UPI0029AE48E6|nr:iron-containing alcohol dehydrogenase [Microbacterium sp. LRZ72]MDX2377547.1 iron-containing alcohol dehydrogenase [Microbacterium sp. LRZ72]
MLRAPAAVYYGQGARASIGTAAASLGRRALVVVDPFLAKTPEFREALSGLDGAGVAVQIFSGVVPELPTDSVTAAAESARGFAPDVVVAYGGGSALDLGKLIALLLSCDGPLSDYYGENRVPHPVLPIVAVPTTAGTGSEATPVAVVSDPDRELKVGVSDPALIPRVAIVDPDLTIGAPPSVTAYSGIDAIVHCAESYTAGKRRPDWETRLPVFVGRNRMSSLLALEGLAAMGDALPLAVADGSNVEARGRMAWGSLLGGMAFGSGGTHLSHALQYPIGALTHTPHGMGTGMMLPYVLQACIETTTDRLAQIAGALGVATDRSERDDAQAAIDRLDEIGIAIGLPRTLAEIGLTRQQIPRVAELAAGVTRLVALADHEVTPAFLERILDAAFVGDRSRLTDTSTNG